MSIEPGLAGRFYTAIDTHTAGMATRIVTSGIGTLHGSTMHERMVHLQQQHDDIRLLLMKEPRGHAAMCGAVIQQSSRPDADLGLLFFSAGGHMEMCGHASIGVCSALMACSVLEARDDTVIRLDTPAGRIDALIELQGGRVSSVTIRPLPAQSIALDVALETSFGTISCDLAWAGGLYAIVSAQSLGVRLDVNGLSELTMIASDIKNAVGRHGAGSDAPRCGHVIFHEKGDGELHCRTVTVHDTFVDRSPCGTGTSALIASLHARGLMRAGKRMTNRSLSGHEFIGHLDDVLRRDGAVVVTTAVTGSAWITGLATYILEPEDPLKTGLAW